MADIDLMRVARALNADIIAHMASGQPSSQAHIGMIEMANACSFVLVERGYHAGAKVDGSDLPVDVQYETVCGIRHKLSFAIRVF